MPRTIILSIVGLAAWIPLNQYESLEDQGFPGVHGETVPGFSPSATEAPDEVAFLAQESCTIRIGGGGDTHTFSITGAEDRRGWASVPASDFIRSTRGPCHFQIYNGADYSGRSVVLGSALSTRIRAGVDGITNKAAGGGNTWRLRSLIIYRRQTTCQLSIGGNGVRMIYYADTLSNVPAMDRISHFVGGDCGANVWNAVDGGADDYDNRFKALHPSGAERAIYDPGFRIRSLQIWDDGNVCPTETRDEGRCLPQATLSSSIYTIIGEEDDRDHDGLNDLQEDSLAILFSPAYYNHSTEDATRAAAYTDARGRQVMEPVTIFQVHPADQPGSIYIRYMKLWLEDRWGGPTCTGHRGDSQGHSVRLTTLPIPNALRGRFWFVVATSGGITRPSPGSLEHALNPHDPEPELQWSRGNRSVRGVHFVRGPGEGGIARHIAIYFSKGKHHEYADGGWSGQHDKDCTLATAHVNGRGEAHDPPLPFRIANLHAPAGRGDKFNLNNVGTRDRPFFDDLSFHGFPGECVWRCGDFYSNDALSPSRHFM
jgi:hypothetical protein